MIYFRYSKHVMHCITLVCNALFCTIKIFFVLFFLSIISTLFNSTQMIMITNNNNLLVLIFFKTTKIQRSEVSYIVKVPGHRK